MSLDSDFRGGLSTGTADQSSGMDGGATLLSKVTKLVAKFDLENF